MMYEQNLSLFSAMHGNVSKEAAVLLCKLTVSAVSCVGHLMVAAKLSIAR